MNRSLGIVADVRPYIVRQGDYLQSIAWTHGVPANQVWSHARNKDLRTARTDPNLLHPGDVLFIPPRAPGAPSLRLGSENCYRSMVARVTVKVAFQDASGRPLAGTPFVVEGIAAPIHGTTDASGVVSFDAPVDCGSVVLRLPEHQRALRVDIGHLDPVAEESGLRARLEHLGYLRRLADARELADAIRTFQREKRLDATGEADDPTRDALVAAHGS